MVLPKGAGAGGDMWYHQVYLMCSDPSTPVLERPLCCSMWRSYLPAQLEDAEHHPQLQKSLRGPTPPRGAVPWVVGSPAGPSSQFPSHCRNLKVLSEGDKATSALSIGIKSPPPASIAGSSAEEADTQTLNGLWTWKMACPSSEVCWDILTLILKAALSTEPPHLEAVLQRHMIFSPVVMPVPLSPGYFSNPLFSEGSSMLGNS